MKTVILLLVIIGYAFFSCQFNNTSTNDNPHEEGFDLANSDPAAVELADSVMVAVGGRKNWDAIRFISLRTEDSTTYYWNKADNKLRIESRVDSTIYLLDLNSNTGKVQLKGKAVSQGEELEKLLEEATTLWSEQALKLFMPFQLKAKDVTLKYLGEDTLINGSKSNVLAYSKRIQQQKEERISIYVDLKDNMIRQIAFYTSPSQDSADWIHPIHRYKEFEKIFLPVESDLNERVEIISVSRTVPKELFSKF
jgi:hypothetical protein